MTTASPGGCASRISAALLVALMLALSVLPTAVAADGFAARPGRYIGADQFNGPISFTLARVDGRDTVTHFRGGGGLELAPLRLKMGGAWNGPYFFGRVSNPHDKGPEPTVFALIGQWDDPETAWGSYEVSDTSRDKPHNWQATWVGPGHPPS